MMGSLWQRLCHGERRVRAEPDWQPLVGPDWAERIMNVAVTNRFHAKQGRSTGRWILERAGKRLAVYLKRHYRLPRWHGVLATFWPWRSWSPAMQEWDHLQWARTQGIPVPRAVAASETIGPWGRLQSCLAVEELADMLPLHEAIPLAATRLDPRSFRRWKKSLACEMARLARLLHGRRRFHKDLYLCHFYISQEATRCLPPWQDRVHLIDLHRLGHHPWTGAVWQVKDLAQLLYSSETAGLTQRDRLVFWRHYREEMSSGWSWLLRRLVLLKAGRYRRHNHERRSKGLQRGPGKNRAA